MKYFGPAGQFSPDELPQPSQSDARSPYQTQTFQSRQSAVIDTTRFMGMGSPSVSSEGSGLTGSNFPATPQSQYYEVPIHAGNSDEPQQWMSLAQFSSAYPSDEEFNQLAHGKY